MSFYTSLALSYRRWHFRMNTAQNDRYGPTMGFAVLQGLNLFSLQLLLPATLFPTGLFVSIPLAAGACAYWLTGRIYRANPDSVSYATNFSASVPRPHEFPTVYAYLLFTLVLFASCVLVAVRNAA